LPYHFTFSVKCPAQNPAIAKLESAALKNYFTALLKSREVNNIPAASNYKNYAENSRRGFYKNIQTNSAAVSRGKIIYNNVLYINNIIKCNRPPAADFPMTLEGGKPRTFTTVRMRLAEILAPSPPPPKPRENNSRTKPAGLSPEQTRKAPATAGGRHGVKRPPQPSGGGGANHIPPCRPRTPLSQTDKSRTARLRQRRIRLRGFFRRAVLQVTRTAEAKGGTFFLLLQKK
jgi:hypothetical protein